MKRSSATVVLGAVVLAGAFALRAGAVSAPAPASAPGISVYTWTDANGTTHFSDTPRKDGPARTIVLPTPAPADRTAQAADRAYLAQLQSDTRARLAQEADQRRAETEREAAYAAAAAQYEAERQPTGYYPVFVGAGHRGHYRQRRDYDHDRRPPSAPPANSNRVFPPAYLLPSSFPDPLASTFPGLPTDPFTKIGQSSPQADPRQ